MEEQTKHVHSSYELYNCLRLKIEIMRRAWPPDVDGIATSIKFALP